MSKSDAEKSGDQGISKVKLALGAASLFFFIIGVKRSFQMEKHQSPPEPPRQPQGTGARAARRGKREEKGKK